MLRRYVPVTRSSLLLLPDSWQHCCTDNARWQRAPTRRCNSIICSLKQNKFHLRTKTRHPTLPLTPPPDTPFTNVFLSRAMTHYWKTASQQAALHTQCAANLSAQCTTPTLPPSCLFGFDSSHEMAARFPPLYVSGWSVCIEVTSIL